MKYPDIVQYFNTEEGILELIGECQEVFDLIDDCSMKLFNNQLKTVADFQEALTRLSGAKMFLDPIANHAEAIAEGAALRKYMEIKNSRAVGEKFVSAAAEKEADVYAIAYNRLYGDCQGYINACMSGIRACEGNLAEFKWDYNRTK